MDWLVRGQDYVFHLAGPGVARPEPDQPVPRHRVQHQGHGGPHGGAAAAQPARTRVFTGTRGQYGPAVAAARRRGGARPIPRASTRSPTSPPRRSSRSTRHPRHPVGAAAADERLRSARPDEASRTTASLNWFVRLAIDDESIKVFGDGQIKRDFLLRRRLRRGHAAPAPSAPAATGEVLNVGIDSADDVSGDGRGADPRRRQRAVGVRAVHAGARPRSRATSTPTSRKIRRLVGWRPRTSLTEGLARTVAFYRQHKQHYWDSPRPARRPGGVSTRSAQSSRSGQKRSPSRCGRRSRTAVRRPCEAAGKREHEA